MEAVSHDILVPGYGFHIDMEDAYGVLMVTLSICKSQVGTQGDGRLPPHVLGMNQRMAINNFEIGLVPLRFTSFFDPHLHKDQE